MESESKKPLIHFYFGQSKYESREVELSIVNWEQNNHASHCSCTLIGQLRKRKTVFNQLEHAYSTLFILQN